MDNVRQMYQGVHKGQHKANATNGISCSKIQNIDEQERSHLYSCVKNPVSMSQDVIMNKTTSQSIPNVALKFGMIHVMSNHGFLKLFTLNCIHQLKKLNVTEEDIFIYNVYRIEDFPFAISTILLSNINKIDAIISIVCLNGADSMFQMHASLLTKSIIQMSIHFKIPIIRGLFIGDEGAATKNAKNGWGAHLADSAIHLIKTFTSNLFPKEKIKNHNSLENIKLKTPSSLNNKNELSNVTGDISSIIQSDDTEVNRYTGKEPNKILLSQEAMMTESSPYAKVKKSMKKQFNGNTSSIVFG